MKTKFSIIVVMLVAAFIFGCKKNNDNVSLNRNQQSLLSNLKTAYNGAKLYDDSLITGWTMNHSYTIAMYNFDHYYHMYDSTFTVCINNMAQSGNGMNSVNCNMMNGGNGMMSINCNYDNPDNDVNQIMTQMCELRNLHSSYHFH